MFGKKEIKKSIVDFFPVRDSSTDITYASYDDLCKGRRHIDSIYERIGHTDSENAKKYAEAKKQVATLTKKNASLEKRVASYAKELERMFLQAIGEAETVKQVNAVVGRYNKSSLCAEQVGSILQNIFCVNLSADNATKLNGTSIHQAAATKIKRINTKDAHQLCTMLDTTTSRTLYASSIAIALKGIADIEVDMTKVLAAKDSGLDAWNVLLSMLAAYGVKADSVMEVK